MAGAPGALHLAVRDDAGADSASSLAEDTLVLALEAGPVYCLAVAEPQPIECGLQAVLPLLRVHAMDAYSNASTAANCEVPPLRLFATKHVWKGTIYSSGQRCYPMSACNGRCVVVQALAFGVHACVSSVSVSGTMVIFRQ